MKYPILGTLLLTLTLVGCDHEGNSFFNDEPPAVPTGLTSLALDGQVELWWNANQDHNVDGYNIYSATSANGRYQLIGTSSEPQFVDRHLTNGVVYYYAVSAVDYNGEESDLTGKDVYAIPRPEGFSLALFDYSLYPNTAGYDFSTETLGKYDDQYTDIYFENYQGTLYMDVWSDTDIQDMGYTRTLDDIAYAPADGWTLTKSVMLIKGHTYVVWTNDDHYAKFRVVSLFADHVVVDWAYQTLKAAPELRHRPTPSGPRQLVATAHRPVVQ